MSKTKELFWTFFKIGAFTFGGGYAMVALLQNEFVEEKKIEGAAGAAASTVAVCLPSFAVIYLISLFFDQFLRLSVVASAFHGIQVCVIYLILSAGLKMLKQLERSAFNMVILAAVVLAMVSFSVMAVSFSSIFYILLSGAAGLGLYAVQKLQKGDSVK